MKSLQAKLRKLDNRVFENLTFDLLQSVGLENLIWRTPGADGGRDIEGEFAYQDLTGSVVRQRWFIECKRYSSSIDWPIVWKKLAYAECEQADFLLVATSSTLSPACETQVAKWNAAKKRPTLRAWRGYEFEYLLLRHPVVAIKYGLQKRLEERDRAFVHLASEVAKFTQSAYSAQEFGNRENYLDAAAALAELLSVRLDDFTRFGEVTLSRYDPKLDRYEWQKKSLPATAIDGVGLRAALAVFRCLMRAKTLVTDVEGDRISILGQQSEQEMSDSGRRILRSIGIWSDFEVSFPTDRDGKIMAISRRT